MASDDNTMDEKLSYLLEEDDNFYYDNNHDNDESPNLISRMDNADTFNDDDNDNDDDETNNRPRLMAVRQQHQRQRQQQRRRRQQQEAATTTTTTTVTEGSKPPHLIRRKENDDTTQSSGSEDEEDADDEDSDDDENEDEDSEDDGNDDDDDDSVNDDEEVIAIPEREGGREVTTYDYIDSISDDTSSEDDSDRDDRGHRIHRRVPVVNGGTMENRADNNNEDEGDDDDDDTPPRLVSRSHRQRVRRVQTIIAGVVDVPIVVPVRLLTRQLQGLVHGPRPHMLEQQQQQLLLQGGPAASFDLEELCHRHRNRSTSSTTMGTHAASAKRQALSPAPLLAIMPRISSIVPVDIPAHDIPLVMSQASQFLDPQDMIALLQVETLLWCSMRKSEAEAEATQQQGSSCWHFPQLRHRFCRIHGTKLDLTYEDSAERRRVLLFTTTVLDPPKEQTPDAPALAPRDRSIQYHDNNNNKNNNHNNETDIETDNIQFLLWCLEQQAFITAAIATSNEGAKKKKEKQLCPSSSSTTSLSWPSPSASAATNTTTSTTTTTTTPTSTTTTTTLNTTIVYFYPDCFHCRRGVDESGLENKDIELVMSQIGPQCTRTMSVQALRDNDHDLVNAIMSLTHM